MNTKGKILAAFFLFIICWILYGIRPFPFWLTLFSTIGMFAGIFYIVMITLKDEGDDDWEEEERERKNKK